MRDRGCRFEEGDGKMKEFSLKEGQWQEAEKSQEGKDGPGEKEKSGALDKMKQLFSKKEGKNNPDKESEQKENKENREDKDETE